MAEKIDTNYQLKKGESASAYNKRVADYRASKSNVKETTSVSANAADPFMKALQDRLMKQSDVISSSANGIDRKINESIRGIEKGQSASTARLESQFGRERQNLEEAGANAVDDFRDSRSGFATNMVALRNLVKTTDDNLNDLETRKEEAILLGESEAAKAISALQLQSLTFKQQAEQNVFNNLISMSNFGLSLRQDARAQEGLDLQKRSQTFTEKSALVQIGLEFGVPVSESDTMESVLARVAPMASEQRRLEMQKLTADIRNANAQAERALNGEPVKKLTPEAALMVAETIAKTDPAAFLKLDIETQGQIAPYMKSIKDSEVAELEGAADNMSAEEFLEFVDSDQTTGYSDPAIQEVYTKKYLADAGKEDVSSTPSSLPSLIGDLGGSYSRGVNSGLEWLTGFKRAR